MKIELKNIKHLASLSEETPAYTADVYIDGQLAYHVKNDGHGGCDYQHRARGANPPSIKEIDAFLLKRDGVETTEYHGQTLTFEPSLESECHTLLYRHLEGKQLKRKLSQVAVVFVPGLPEGQYYQYPLGKVKKYLAAAEEQGKPEPNFLDEWYGRIKKANPGCTILNLIDFDDALTIWQDGRVRA